MGYKLTYFNGKGRAEPVRLLFAHAGVQYEDKRLEGAEWPAVKPTTPWGNMPILEDGDFKLAQSVPILQYVAAKHGYSGATAQETAKCNEYVGAINDFYQGFREAGVEPDPEKKKERLAKFTKETQPFYLAKFESILSQNGSYLVGKKITFVDFYVAHILESYVGANPGVLSAYPSLQKHQETVFGAPGVKEWVAKRPVTPF